MAKKTRMWRALGAFANSGVGAELYRAGGEVTNAVAGRLSTRRVGGPIPWASFDKPLREATVALVTTSGIHHIDDEPFDCDAVAGDPSYRAIPADTPRDALTISHLHYPLKPAEQDRNVVLPMDRLRELADAGALRLAPRHFSFGFVGTITRRIVDEPDGTGHRLARELRSDEVDLAIFIPA
jgi:D-proline reductase (dithiol) PrdB